MNKKGVYTKEREIDNKLNRENMCVYFLFFGFHYIFSHRHLLFIKKFIVLLFLLYKTTTTKATTNTVPPTRPPTSAPTLTPPPPPPSPSSSSSLDEVEVEAGGPIENLRSSESVRAQVVVVPSLPLISV